MLKSCQTMFSVYAALVLRIPCSNASWQNLQRAILLLPQSERTAHHSICLCFRFLSTIALDSIIISIHEHRCCMSKR